MKKLLLSLSLVAGFTAAYAQQDTLSSHTQPDDVYLGLLDVAAPLDSGFVMGNNGFGDLAKMQLFDATYGVTSGGSITGVAFPCVFAMGAGSVAIEIYSDNSGQPNYATPLASKVVALSDIDTTILSFAELGDGNLYNNIIMFDNPVAIPANQKFWAGFKLPTSGIFATFLGSIEGSTIGNTHCGEIWDDESFHLIGPSWSDATLALTIYPIVEFTLSLEDKMVSSSVYPNPAKDVLNFETSEDIASVVVTTTDGKVVITGDSKTVSVAELNAGMYIYKITTISGKIGTGNFVKN